MLASIASPKVPDPIAAMSSKAATAPVASPPQSMLANTSDPAAGESAAGRAASFAACGSSGGCSSASGVSSGSGCSSTIGCSSAGGTSGAVSGHASAGASAGQRLHSGGGSARAPGLQHTGPGRALDDTAPEVQLHDQTSFVALNSDADA
mmetsp:Transcript_24808/g.69562  ORF Transcript_24808/g.69562 Transcript_24808/m.69562 type:complete len:150 (+) Transcript_24808:576-1025(+)